MISACFDLVARSRPQISPAPLRNTDSIVTQLSAIAMVRSVRAGVAVLLFAASPCGGQSRDSTDSARTGARAHVDSLFHGHGFDGTGGIHAGVPAILSVSPGTKLWLGDALPGAIFLSVEPGVLDVRYGGGYQVYDERLFGVGGAVRFARLVGWSNALGAARGVQYSGTEIAVSWAFALSARAGGDIGRGSDGRKLHLTTVDIGFGF